MWKPKVKTLKLLIKTSSNWLNQAIKTKILLHASLLNEDKKGPSDIKIQKSLMELYTKIVHVYAFERQIQIF